MTAVERTSSDLAGVVDLVARSQGDGVVTVTEDGEPVAVVLAPQEWRAIRETLDILTVPGQADAIDEGLRDIREGRLADGPTAVARFLPPS